MHKEYFVEIELQYFNLKSITEYFWQLHFLIKFDRIGLQYNVFSMKDLLIDLHVENIYINVNANRQTEWPSFTGEQKIDMISEMIVNAVRFPGWTSRKVLRQFYLPKMQMLHHLWVLLIWLFEFGLRVT